MSVKRFSVVGFALIALGFFGAGCSPAASRTTPKQLAPATAPTAAPTIPPEAANVPRPY